MSAGVARTGIEVKMFGDEDTEVPRGEMGELVVRGPTVMSGYWRRHEATAETLRNGWLHTGDVGFMDEGGYVYLMDRKKDMIISGGANIYPREVEEVIQQHPAVKEVAVIGVPDDLWGEAVKAIVQAVDPAAAGLELEEDLLSYCRGDLQIEVGRCRRCSVLRSRQETRPAIDGPRHLRSPRLSHVQTLPSLALLRANTAHLHRWFVVDLHFYLYIFDRRCGV